MPWDRDNYVHRIGRTGRVGHKGNATSFVVRHEQKDMDLAPALIKVIILIDQKIRFSFNLKITFFRF